MTRTSGQGQQAFRESYKNFLSDAQGIEEDEFIWPVHNGEELDLCKLYHEVKRRGGFAVVTQAKKWLEVALAVFGQGNRTGLANLARQVYSKHLYDYEMFVSGPSGRQRQAQAQPAKRRKRAASEDPDFDPDMDSDDERGATSDSAESDADFEEKEAGPDGALCEQCGLGGHGEVMILCDRCDAGYHLYCLSPPLDNVPEGDWFCPACVCSARDSFGFLEGKVRACPCLVAFPMPTPPDRKPACMGTSVFHSWSSSHTFISIPEFTCLEPASRLAQLSR